MAQAAKVDDGTIKTHIETKLKASSSLKGDTIDVAVANGVVTLTGTVHSMAQKGTAAALAKVDGVSTIENKLDVDSATERKMDAAAAKTDHAMDKAGAETKKAAVATKDATVKAADKTKDAAVKTGEVTKDAAVKTGHATKEAVATTGEVITDTWITTKLKADFVNEDTLKGSNINVDTTNYVVTLKGTVTSAAGKTRAAEIAKTTKGVKSVINTLVIAPKS
jgi:hyperosmotically inducible protein